MSGNWEHTCRDQHVRGGHDFGRFRAPDFGAEQTVQDLPAQNGWFLPHRQVACTHERACALLGLAEDIKRQTMDAMYHDMTHCGDHGPPQDGMMLTGSGALILALNKRCRIYPREMGGSCPICNLHAPMGARAHAWDSQETDNASQCTPGAANRKGASSGQHRRRQYRRIL